MNNFIISHQWEQGGLFCDVFLTSLPPVIQDGNPEAPLRPLQRLHITTFPGQKQRPQPAERHNPFMSSSASEASLPLFPTLPNLYLCAFQVRCLSSRTILDETREDRTLSHGALNLSESLCYLSLLVPALVPCESGHLLLPAFMKPSLVPDKWHKSLRFSSSARIILTPKRSRSCSYVTHKAAPCLPKDRSSLPPPLFLSSDPSLLQLGLNGSSIQREQKNLPLWFCSLSDEL